MADKLKDSQEGNPVPRIQVESSADDSSPDSTASERAWEGGESSTDSPNPFSPFTSGADSSTEEGAVRGQEETEEELAEKARQLQIQATTLDKRGLHSGKLDVFRKFFNHDDLEFCTRPEGRQRHRAQRQRHYSEGEIPASGHGSLENPLAVLQVENPGAEAVLNQAGAIVGVDTPASEFANLRGNGVDQFHPIFGPVGDPLHSLSSAPTVPIVEAYAGNYSPVEERSSTEASDRGMSSGSSFPSFPSHITDSSGSFNLKISPLPNYILGSASRMSPVSTTDSDSLPPERPVRRRKVSVTSNPMAIPPRSKSAHVVGYPDKATGAVPKRKISKDSSVDSSGERASSEDDFSAYPGLLSLSVESEACFPVPDVSLATESLQQGMDALRTAAQMQSTSMLPDVSQNLETEESESEAEQSTVLSYSPGTSEMKHSLSDDEAHSKSAQSDGNSDEQSSAESKEITKDSPGASGEQTSSEKEFAYRKLLALSGKSEPCLPVLDVGLATESLQQGMDVLRVAAEMQLISMLFDVAENLHAGESEHSVSDNTRSQGTVKVERPPVEDVAARSKSGSHPSQSSGAVPKKKMAKDSSGERGSSDVDSPGLSPHSVERNPSEQPPNTDPVAKPDRRDPFVLPEVQENPTSWGPYQLPREYMHFAPYLRLSKDDRMKWVAEYTGETLKNSPSEYRLEADRSSEAVEPAMDKGASGEPVISEGSTDPGLLPHSAQGGSCVPPLDMYREIARLRHATNVGRVELASILFGDIFHNLWYHENQNSEHRIPSPDAACDEERKQSPGDDD